MIELARTVCGVLCGATARARDVAGSLGEVVEDPDGMPLVVRPSDARLSVVRVAREPSGEAASVDLVAAEGALPGVAALVAAFGPYRVPPRVSWNSPVRIVFAPDPGADLPAACTIIATLGPGADPIDAGAAAVLTLRRDPR